MPAVGVAVGDRPVDRVAQVPVPVDHVVPGRGVGVLEVRHEPVGAGIQGVDRHLAIGRPGDLDPALLQVGRGGRHGPVALADLARVGKEVEHLPLGQPRSPAPARLEKFLAPGPEPVLQLGHELERVGVDDLVEARLDRAGQLDPGVARHPAILSSSAGARTRRRDTASRTVSVSAAHSAAITAATAAATAHAASPPATA